MSVTPWTKEERARILERHREEMAGYREALAKDDDERCDRHVAAANALEAAYYDRIPVVPMGACPFDGKVLYRTFDPLGFDGFWWESSATPPEPPACTHFCLVQGAVGFGDVPPFAGHFEVRPGPEVPFVIPRLLGMDGMVAVISRIEMEPGWLAYPIAYFAEQRPPAPELTASWARTLHTWVDDFGEKGWRPPADPYDFELAPWLARGKVRWCDPGGTNETLSADPPDTCPYVGLPGLRERTVLQRDRRWSEGVPSGMPPLF